MGAKDYIGLFAGVVTLAAFLTTFFEYRRQGAAKRTDRFIEIRQRLRGNAEFVRICELLERDDSQLRDVPLLVKDNFVGFFEELTLLWNSKVFNDQVVFYMFGYYALKCWRSRNFWVGLNREQQVWGHFRDMVSRLEDLEKSFKVDRRQYRV